LTVPVRVLINNWKTWTAWSKDRRASDSDVILTESPGVYEALRGECEVHDVSVTMTPEESRDLCGRVADLARDWRRVLDDRLYGLFPGEEPGRIFSRDLANVMVRMAYHRALLERAAEEGIVLVPYVRSAPGNRLDRIDTQVICPHGVNYFGLAAQAGIPGVEPLALEPAPVVRNENGDISSPERIALLFLLRIAATRPTFIFHHLLNPWERLSQIGVLLGRLPRHAFVYTTNGLLLHEVPGLIWGRCSVSRVTFKPASTSTRGNVSLQGSLLDATPPELRNALTPAAQKVEELTNSVLLPALDPMRGMVDAEIRRHATDRRSVLLSGSIVDPVGVLMTRCFAERNVACVQFQHGGIGLIDQYLKSQFFSPKTAQLLSNQGRSLWHRDEEHRLDLPSGV